MRNKGRHLCFGRDQNWQLKAGVESEIALWGWHISQPIVDFKTQEVRNKFRGEIDVQMCQPQRAISLSTPAYSCQFRSLPKHKCLPLFRMTKIREKKLGTFCKNNQKRLKGADLWQIRFCWLKYLSTLSNSMFSPFSHFQSFINTKYAKLQLALLSTKIISR